MDLDKKSNKSKKNNKLTKSILLGLGLALITLYIYNLATFSLGMSPKELTYSEFYQKLVANPKTKEIKTLFKTDSVLQGELSNGSKFFVNIPEEDRDLIALIRTNVDNFSVKPARTLLANIFVQLVPVVLFIVFLWYFAYRGTQAGNKIWSFGRSRARVITEIEATKITFDDVAGVDEAKEELKEVIEFLKDPKRFQRLGGKIPKGVLLIGPPGTGKTLLAKAVAGEAKVPFFSISGSDFVEMFVGVGASRVRDLFEQGRKAAKIHGKGAIIFIDEIDAVGRLRFSGIGGGHDEREQTLNALLVEMDGFDTQEGIILIAATNRPDTLDPALLRPGRFDRRIVVNLPDIKGREDILKVHTRKIKLSPEVDLRSIARQTVYFSGADIANLCNEAALLAARRNKATVETKEMEEAIERVIMGPEKKSRNISKREKELTAYHEAGHALISLLIPEVDQVSKVSIIPRGMAGGYTLTPPIEDRHFFSKKELVGRITVTLGGRASEEINLGEVTTGAENDLAVATSIARQMVCEYGMSEKLGNLTLGRRHGPVFLGRDMLEEKDYSEETAKAIDQEVSRIVNESYSQAKKLISERKDKLKIIADKLLEKEVLDGEEVKKILGIEGTAAA
ncbi:MAG: ATP-dependent zinc metalloprotease FtsH [Candidatus Omnitrophica bacterium]|nr:ATP-dependent zinc metalloprotease FtsH [Candidatus Omnitrophota bacterium]HOX54156.1 ATP-dependent zinc metalloprotease FtsH [Candidatus Omnitrophota bacterium]